MSSKERQKIQYRSQVETHATQVNRVQRDQLSKMTVVNENGSVLLFVLGMLAVMSVLAIMLMSTATTEIQSSANFRSSYESLYAANRVIEYATSLEIGTETSIDFYNDIDSSTDTTYLSQLEYGNSGLIASEVSNTEALNSSQYLGESPPPSGSGSDMSLFVAKNYAITAAGAFPANSTNPAQTVLRAQVAKLAPNSN
jgi:hypothetical protein